MKFWHPDNEHMCSKHVEAWNKVIVKQNFCTSSWLITEINIGLCFLRAYSGRFSKLPLSNNTPLPQKKIYSHIFVRDKLTSPFSTHGLIKFRNKTINAQPLNSWILKNVFLRAWGKVCRNDQGNQLMKRNFFHDYSKNTLYSITFLNINTKLPNFYPIAHFCS